MQTETKYRKLIEKFLKGKTSIDEETSLWKDIASNEYPKEQFLIIAEQTKTEIANSPEKSTTKQWELLVEQIAPERTKKSHKNKTKQTIISLSRYAAVLLLGIVTTVISFQLIGYKQTTAPIISQQTQTISTPRGARSNFLLPDGSTVWLNAGSSITFNLDMQKSRQISLDGEAYFEVQKNNIPFRVQTQHGEVQVKGTTFNVKAYTNDIFTTTVESGSVLVALANSKSHATISSGEQAFTKENSENISTQTVDTKIYTSWRDGILIFHRDPLEIIVKKLERWYNVEIDVTPRTRLKNYRFTGTIEMESLTEVLELIRVTAPIKYTYDAKKRTVIIDTKE